ncbi:MAG TPA: carbamate kinase [Gemmatimonadetes bacterium]|jgi:carbamate kinase|nr:carbamate kinase [Gemmatimonadota bacterium]
MTETRTAVIAVGGNALSPPGEHSTIADQFRHTRDSLGPIVDLVLDGWRVVVVHGNGPQVGDELVRNEKARSEVSPLPLGVLVAGTAGWIGYMLQQSLENALRKAGHLRDVVTVLTQVEVAADDPALKDPKKFIGHGLSVVRARELKAQGHSVKKDGKGHFRRVVGSPRPLAIHELATIRTLLERDTVVIACGGGGVPVYRHAVLGLEGIDAVVDKDLAAAVLARELGAELFLILTDVDAVYSGWGTEQQRAISSMTVSEADRLASEGAFGEGSMAPKVAAAADYVRRTQGRAIITELSKGRAAVQGVGGTEILP